MIQTDISSITYAGNASIVTPYPVPFYFFEEADLSVIVKDPAGIEEAQILGTDYTVIGEGDPNGGSITLTWAAPADHVVSIVRDIPATQLTSYEEADAFPAKSHERALDKLTMLVQQALRLTGGGGPTDLGRAFRLTEASTGINAVAKINDTSLGLDAMGNAILRSSGEMLGWLGQVATVWANDAERDNTRGAYAGQVGVQLDNYTIYVSRSTDPGDWMPFLKESGIVISTQGVPTAEPHPAGDLVGTTASQTLTNKTIEGATLTDPTGLDADDVGLGNVDNTSDLTKPLSSDAVAALAAKQNLAQKGFANGYTPLDSAGKVPITHIPDSVVGASQYQGTWNAATNTPAIPAAALGNKGWYYQVAVAGTTSINGVNSWAVGDIIISQGTVWQKIPNYSAVVSVNAKTGVVVIDKNDVLLGNVDNTSDATKNSAVATLTNKTISGANNTLTVRLDADVVNNLPTSRLNNGTGAGPATWWCGDGSWKAPAGGGDILGPASAADSEIPLYSGTTGKLLKRATGTGIVNVTNGVYQTPIALSAFPPTGVIMDYMGNTEPTGWLLCDGRPVSQATYGALYSLLGVNFTPRTPFYAGGTGLGLYPNDAAGPYTLPNVTVAAGTDRLMLVWLIHYQTVLRNVVTVKFGGVSLTKLHENTFYSTTGMMQLWYLKNPAVSTASVVVTTDAPVSQIVIQAEVYNGVHQTTTFGTPLSYPSYAAVGTNQLNVDSAYGDLVVGGISTSTDDYLAMNVGQTETLYTAGYAPAYFGIRSSSRVKYKFPYDPTYDTDTLTMLWWNYHVVQGSTCIGVALKPSAAVAGMFYLPDLRGRVIAGRDNMGGFRSGRMSPIEVYGDTQGTTPGYEYIYNIAFSYSAYGWPRYPIQAGMQVTGPGIPANTFVTYWYTSGTVAISKTTTALVRGGKYTFFWPDADTSVVGSVLGKADNTLTVDQLALHNHTFYALAGQGGPHVPGGSGWGFSTAGGNSNGFDIAHNNIQPTFIANKIIKT